MKIYLLACIASLAACSRQSAETTDANAATPTDRTASSSAGTATDAERRAYSADLYNKPQNLSGEAETRYNNMSPQGHEYVDEKMAQYDEYCKTHTC